MINPMDIQRLLMHGDPQFGGQPATIGAPPMTGDPQFGGGRPMIGDPPTGPMNLHGEPPAGPPITGPPMPPPMTGDPQFGGGRPMIGDPQFRAALMRRSNGPSNIPQNGGMTSLHEKLLAGNTVYDGMRMSPHSGGGTNFGRPRQQVGQISKDALRRRIARTGR